jgi:phosphomannomutase
MGKLMVSISGIRGIVGNGFDPHSIVKYTSAFADFIGDGKIVVGRSFRRNGKRPCNRNTFSKRIGCK